MAWLICYFQASAQIRSCGSDEIHLQSLIHDPSYQQIRQNIEAHSKKFYTKQGLRNSSIKIPVVVHIIYNSDAQNLSDSLIATQIEALNRDFGQLFSTKYDCASSSKIEFVLASSDPEGIKSTGITRTHTAVNSFSTGAMIMSAAHGGHDAWPAAYYLNIWVGNINGVLGYAYMPGNRSDGVVINYKYFGQTNRVPFHMGRTATHEVGHWLNLYHTWGLNTGCEADDEVEDTPNSAAPNYGCKTDHESCGGTDMVENYMDYSDDACMNLFTKGQVNRMEALFAPGGYRAAILNSPGLSEGIVDLCHNGIMDGDETGIDCGGGCTACPTCHDGIQNGSEAGVDCGGDCKPCYCVSKSEFSFFDYIQRVSINDSVSITGDNTGYFHDQHVYFPIYSNGQNHFILQPNKTDYASREFWSIWIDWNKDGWFDGKDELVYSKDAIGGLVDSISITSAVKNLNIGSDTLHIRIQMKWGSKTNSGCDTFDFGEVEDYKIRILEKYIDPCTNGIQDQDETGIDCGPHCLPCEIHYCESKSMISKYEFINRITWNAWENVSGKNNGFGDFTSSPVGIAPGSIIKYTLEAGFAGNYRLNEYWSIWADWNKDGDFDDENELIIRKGSILALNGSIKIPENIAGMIRIRVIMSDAANTKSCGTFNYGETEDYTFDISPGDNRLYRTDQNSVNIFPNPATDFINIQSTSNRNMESVEVMNELGAVILKTGFSSSFYKIKAANFSSGIYLLRIKSEGQTIIKRVWVHR